nr:MFS transporter [Patulibacter sp. SYSU D01012]
MWLTYAPITTASAERLGVSETAVGWLAQLYPLLYVVLALPAAMLLDRWLRPALAAGAVLTAAGGLVRPLGGGDAFGTALAGQLLAAAGQPLVLGAVGLLAVATLVPRDRPAGIALGSAGVVVGQLVALVLGPVLGAGRLPALVAVQAALAVLAAGALLVVLRRVPAGVAGAAPVPVRAVWADRGIRTLAAVVFVGFGVFVALTTWLQALLEPAGVSDDAAGLMLVLMLVVGVAATAALPPRVAGRREVPFLGTVLVVAAGACVVLGAVHVAAVNAVAVIAAGALLAAALPVVFAMTERRAGAAAGTGVTLMWLAGNVGGLLVAAVVGTLLDHRLSAFGLLALVAVLGLLPARRLLGPAAAPAPAVGAGAAEG